MIWLLNRWGSGLARSCPHTHSRGVVTRPGREADNGQEQVGLTATTTQSAGSRFCKIQHPNVLASAHSKTQRSRNPVKVLIKRVSCVWKYQARGTLERSFVEARRKQGGASRSCSSHPPPRPRTWLHSLTREIDRPTPSSITRLTFTGRVFYHPTLATPIDRDFLQ